MKEIQTPYGLFTFTDDSTSFILLDWFSQSAGDFRIDSINTRVIVDVCKICDGALSEMMGFYCLKDIENKPECIVSIYKSDNLKGITDYVNLIAIELVIRNKTILGNESQFELLSNRLEDCYSECREYPMLLEILYNIKERYEFWLTQDI